MGYANKREDVLVMEPLPDPNFSVESLQAKNVLVHKCLRFNIKVTDSLYLLSLRAIRNG
jgi:hypothetical protein